MSDLQCAASVVVLGPVPSAAVLARLPERRVALVYASGEPATTATAADVAAALGVTARPAVESRGEGDGPPADGVLDDLADEHRGECVVLVVGRQTLDAMVTPSGGDAAGGLVVEIDEDGRRVTALPTAR